jgi:hypothetical protein
MGSGSSRSPLPSKLDKPRCTLSTALSVTAHPAAAAVMEITTKYERGVSDGWARAGPRKDYKSCIRRPNAAKTDELHIL